jgi:YVTN family beta-propeller protein
LLVANRGVDSLVLIDTSTGSVKSEVACGAYPTRVRWGPDGQVAYVVCRDSHRVDRFELADGKLTPAKPIPCGDHPVDIAIVDSAESAYISLENRGVVLHVDLSDGSVIHEFVLGRGVGMLALSADGQFLGVTVGSIRGVKVVDLSDGTIRSSQSFMGINFGHLTTSSDGSSFYFPWMVYRDNPITASNIRKGWVLASRVARLRFDSDQRREALSLDPPGRAAADPTGLVLSSRDDVVIAAGGTHEILVLASQDLPWKAYGGTDHLPLDLQRDSKRFRRIRVGGRPMGLALASDDKTLYVANSLAGAIQVVDLEAGKVQVTWTLAEEKPTLARQGEAIFYDARRSLDQWYSCHSCHQDGGSNAVTMDTLNDGSTFTKKTVLPLYSLKETAPYTWHGWQHNLRNSLQKSLNTTMLGRNPSPVELDALQTYLSTLRPPPNPNRESADRLQRGRKLFVGKAGCATCHSGDHGTDGQMHDVGLGGRQDRYPTFNTPSLRAVYRKQLLLHDGRASSLEEMFDGPDHPALVLPKKLTAKEVADLVAYLRSL